MSGNNSLPRVPLPIVPEIKTGHEINTPQDGRVAVDFSGNTIENGRFAQFRSAASLNRLNPRQKVVGALLGIVVVAGIAYGVAQNIIPSRKVIDGDDMELAIGAEPDTDGGPEPDTDLGASPVPVTTPSPEVASSEEPASASMAQPFDLSVLESLTVTNGESAFDCITDGDGTNELIRLDDGTVFVDVFGNSFVEQKLVSRIPNVDGDVRDNDDPEIIDVQDTLKFSRSIANPIELDHLDDPAEALLEFKNTICESPEVAEMVADYFAKLEVGGVNIVDLNSWLEDRADADSSIRERALELVPLYADPDNTTPEEALVANLAHQVLAENLATLLDAFENAGIHENIMTTFNYTKEAGGLVAGQGALSEIVANDTQYEGRFIVLKLTHKDGRCFSVMLINTEDQRVAEGIVDDDQCDDEIITTTEKPEPDPTTTPEPDPTEKPEPDPTTTPEPDPTPAPTPTVVPPKVDDGELSGDADVPASGDPGTPDTPGVGPAGQAPGSNGYLPSEIPVPTQAPAEPTATAKPAPTATAAPAATPAPTAIEAPTPAVTSEPVDAGGDNVPDNPETGELPDPDALD